MTGDTHSSRSRNNRQDVSPGRRWTRPLPAVGILVVLISAGALVLRAGSTREIGLGLTHTIARGDLIVTVTEQGTLESADNAEIKCKVRGQNTIIRVVESGTVVEPGDELVRLDTLAIEDAIAERTKYAHLTRSGAERAKADVARAELAIPEYLEGRYRTELMTLQKDLAIAMSNERTGQNMLAHTEVLAERGYVSGLELQEAQFAVTQAELNVGVQQTRIDVLTEFTKAMELETLHGNLNAAQARFTAESERAQMDAQRRDLALAELEHCVVRAERGGLVIYPRPERWKRAPEIEEGATVHRNQTLLLMPDLSKMQVRVGIHESIVDRIRPGLEARVTLPDRTLDGVVSSVSEVTRPAGWWTGNVVKYDTIVKLPSVQGLKPGMSAEVEVTMARHEDVLMIPAAAVLQTRQGNFCWVRTAEAIQRRSLQLGDTDDKFVLIETGLQEGDEVVIDPLASIKEAQMLVLRPRDEATSGEPARPEADHVN